MNVTYTKSASGFDIVPEIENSTKLTSIIVTCDNASSTDWNTLKAIGATDNTDRLMAYALCFPTATRQDYVFKITATDAASLIKIGDFPAFDQGADTRATGKSARWNIDRPINILTDAYDDRTLYNVVAYYAPAYEWKDVSSYERPQSSSLKNDKQAGTDEYLVFYSFYQSLRNDIYISFEEERRDSRQKLCRRCHSVNGCSLDEYGHQHNYFQ